MAHMHDFNAGQVPIVLKCHHFFELAVFDFKYGLTVAVRFRKFGHLAAQPVAVKVLHFCDRVIGLKLGHYDSDALVRAIQTRYVDSPQIQRILDRVDHTSEVIARDAEPLLKDAREALKGVSSPEQQAKIKAAISDLAEVANRSKAIAADAQVIVSHIRKGNGSVGAFVMDEQLYDDIQELARDLKHNPWKFFWRE